MVWVFWVQNELESLKKNKVGKNWVCGYTATPNAAWGNEVSDQKTCTGMEKVVGP